MCQFTFSHTQHYSSQLVYLVNHGLGDHLLVSNTDSFLQKLSLFSEAELTSSQTTTLSTGGLSSDVSMHTRNSSDGACQWRLATREERKWGLRLTVSHDKVRDNIIVNLRGGV